MNNTSRFTIPLALLTSALFVVDAALAQTQIDTQVRSQETLKKAETSLDDSIGWGFEEDEEFGALVVMKEAKDWWITPRVGGRFYWTSNAFLSDRNEKGDAIFVETQGITTGYRITRDWRVQAGYAYEMVRYNTYPFLDVDSHATDFCTVYQLPWSIQASAGVRFLWLEAPRVDDEIYSECAPFLNLSQNHYFCDGRLTAFYGYEFSRRLADIHAFDRDEHMLFAGVSYAWRDDLVSTLMHRETIQLYEVTLPNQADCREEWNHTVTFQTVWQPLNWLQVSGFASYNYDNSVNAFRDNHVVNTGGEIRLFYKF